MINESYLNINLSHLSKYRTQMMGLAALMIIACHAPASDVAMPSILRQVLGFGNYGVGVFFFLSGIGCWYSLNKGTGGGIFLKRRFIRISIPYLLIFIPYNLLLLFLVEGYSFVDCILSLTTIDFWIYHRGAWFVAALVPLYLITPLLYSVLSGKYKWTVFISIMVVLMLITTLELDNHSNDNIISNIRWVIQRIPPFVLGVAIAKGCIDKKTISALWIVLITVAYLICRLCGHDEFGWLLLPFIIYCLLMLCQFVEKYNAIYQCITFMGVVSLESYLLNISLNKLFGIIARSIDSPIFYGRYLEYSLVIIIGIILSYYANKLSKKITILI